MSVCDICMVFIQNVLVMGLYDEFVRVSIEHPFPNKWGLNSAMFHCHWHVSVNKSLDT